MGKEIQAMLFLLTVSQMFGFKTNEDNLSCKTVDGGPVVDEFCQFPFVYNNVTYNECTDEDYGLNKWCPTDENWSGNSTHFSNQWGKCSCDFINQSTATTTITPTTINTIPLALKTTTSTTTPTSIVNSGSLRNEQPLIFVIVGKIILVFARDWFTARM